MSFLAITGALLGAASAAKGAVDAAEAAKKKRNELKKERARNNAWYARNYYEDYLNTVAAYNAINRARDSWANATKEARARQAVTGGTVEQAAAVAEAGGEAMGNTIANVAAQGEANKRAVDAQKQAMDANVAAQEGAIADAQQQAGMNLLENGIGVATSAAQMMSGKKAPKATVATAEQAAATYDPVKLNGSYTTGEVTLENGIKVPDKIITY